MVYARFVAVFGFFVLVGCGGLSDPQKINAEYDLCLDDTFRDGIQITEEDKVDAWTCYQKARQRCLDKGYTPECFESD
jgi:hypothetical protein